MSADQYYYRDNGGEVRGPLSLAVIRTAVAAGRLTLKVEISQDRAGHFECLYTPAQDAVVPKRDKDNMMSMMGLVVLGLMALTITGLIAMQVFKGDPAAARDKYLHEHAFDGGHEEEMRLLTAALDCNGSAIDIINTEADEYKARDHLREAKDVNERAALTIDLDHAKNKAEKANEDYRNKASVLSEWQGLLAGKANRYERAISKYLASCRGSKNEKVLFSYWTLDSAMKWAEENP